MDSAVTGNNTPQERTDEVAEEKSKTVGKPPRRPDWMLIALIAVSCVAVLLLAATVTLAVTGDFGHHRGQEMFRKFGGGRMGPMRGQGERRQRDRFPGPRGSSATQDQQAQPPQPQSAPQSSQAQPPAGQGP